MLSIQIYSEPGGRLLADITRRVGLGGGATFSTNGHGFAAMSAPLVPCSLREAFEWYSWPGLPHVVVGDGAGVVWEGRLEDIGIVEGGVALMALGYQRALYDLPYTALWSKSGTADWKPSTENRSGATPARYQTDNNNRLYITPKKGETFGNNADYGELTSVTPHGGLRELTHLTASYDVTLPADWQARIYTSADDYSSLALDWTLTATGSNQTGTIDIDLTPNTRVLWHIRNATGGSYTATADSGVWYAKLTNVRVTSADSVVASAIAAALAAQVAGENPAQLLADTMLIEATTTDLLDEIYEDRYPADILSRLATLHGYEWGVYEGRWLFFRSKGAGRQWYIDAARPPELQRSLEGLRNSAYATYRGADGRTLRTGNVGDGGSQARYGVRRRGFVSVQTTSLGEAQLHRGVFLADRATLAARAGIVFDRLYDAQGSIWPLWSMRSGDTVTIRNLPPTLGTDIDRIRTFRVAETEYDAAAGVLSIAPEEPLPLLDVMLARREAGL